MAEQKYRVIRRLAAGGMAEVFLGESSSVQGFKKRVAIKRVLPHLAQNDKFIQMFLDEARLSARLSHANIVTVFDIGSADNTYFLVMEYVDGVNLKEILQNARKSGIQFQPKRTAYIGMEVCRGLSYAHELTDEHGQLLGIVHRDISPPNIMITRRGEVKVADFGLAKAGIQVEKTEPGVVKGKFGYLAPEVAHGEEAEPRSDVFSLGIVLWEMLAGRRLFLGETDYQTVKLVQQANVPRLSPLNRYVDEAFEEVIFHALARHPDDRYSSAREFGDALAGYLFAKGLKVTAYDVANLVTSLTSDKATYRPKSDQIIDRLIQQELQRFTSIDDDARPVQRDLTRGTPSAFPRPRDSGALENPAAWFVNDSDFLTTQSSHPPAIGTQGGDTEPGTRSTGTRAASAARSGAAGTGPLPSPRPVGDLGSFGNLGGSGSLASFGGQRPLGPVAGAPGRLPPTAATRGSPAQQPAPASPTADPAARVKEATSRAGPTEHGAGPGAPPGLPPPAAPPPVPASATTVTAEGRQPPQRDAGAGEAPAPRPDATPRAVGQPRTSGAEAFGPEEAATTVSGRGARPQKKQKGPPPDQRKRLKPAAAGATSATVTKAASPVKYLLVALILAVCVAAAWLGNLIVP